MNQRIIGVTGGIATGKTTVTNYLHQRYHLPILDADLYARAAITQERLQVIQERYGAEILTPSGELNRQHLGTIIFNNKLERRWLENLIHPYVKEQLCQNARSVAPAPVVMAIPLLFEANLQNLVTEIWVVNCPLQLQIERLCERSHLTIEEAMQRISAQMPMTIKIAQADVVLDNSIDLPYLWQQIDRYINESV